MPRRTRRSVAKASSPDSSDLDNDKSSPGTPMFSKSTTATAKTTPALSTASTADADSDEKAQRKTTAKKRSRKDTEDDDIDMDDGSPAAGVAKRRAVSKQFYVEIPVLNYRKGKGKSPPPIGKGKAKAVPTKTSTRPSRRVTTSTVTSTRTSNDDEEEILEPSQSELEFDENQDLEDSEESDDDGSVFEGSDEENEAEEDEDSEEEFEEVVSPMKRKTTARQTRGRAKSEELDEDEVMELEMEQAMIGDAAFDDDEEAAMLSLAVSESLALSTPRTANEAGPSSSKSRSKAAKLRANAAERRAGKEILSDEESAVMSDALSDESNGGGFVNEGKKKSYKPTVGGKKGKMTLSMLKAERREERKLKKAELSDRKKMERAEAKRLGRKLTVAEKTTLALHHHHPELKDVWGNLERTVKPIQPERAEQPDGLKVTLLGFQQESLFWMRKQEKGIWRGGCLADEMGMGKTIQTLALLVSDKRKPNLIIAPTVAVMQWKNEIEAHTNGLKISIFHGAGRETNVKELAKYDVVLTTYSVLESSYRKQKSGFKRKGVMVKEKSPLHSIEWARVVLDEAHNIKERSCNTAKATFELQAKFRWCLSGTPLQNRVGELYSLVRFLGGDPFSYYFCKDCSCKSLHWSFSNKKNCDDCGHSPMKHTCFWNNEILTPIQKHGMQGPGGTAFQKLKILLDRMMLRRTKLERADDLGLPPRTVIVRRDYFSPEEKELYLSLFSDAKRQFSTYVDAGTLLNNYSNIFSLITRMRQMACHPDLVLKSRRNQQFSADIVEAAVCRLCSDVAEDAIQSKCHHVFDRECIKQYLNTSIERVPECPVCHVPLSIDLEAPAMEQDDEVVNKTRQGILGRLNFDGWRSSSKIEALVEELSNLRRDDRTTKSIVFSQFVNFLDLIAWRLQRAGFVICRLEGTMSPQARDATIKHFMNNVEVTVFLVSLKAGGVALNLVEASRVYLMDSWWNPAVEYQAMDRIHRLGQHRPVQAIKLVVEDSIESRIVQLQEKKSAMVDATLSSDDSAMGRLTPEDLGFLFRL